MPIISNFKLPASASALDRPKEYSAPPFFITFVASNLPETGESWCPDVRAALPVLQEAFAAADTPEMAIVEVGQRLE